MRAAIALLQLLYDYAKISKVSKVSDDDIVYGLTAIIERKIMFFDSQLEAHLFIRIPDGGVKYLIYCNKYSSKRGIFTGVCSIAPWTMYQRYPNSDFVNILRGWFLGNPFDIINNPNNNNIINNNNPNIKIQVILHGLVHIPLLNCDHWITSLLNAMDPLRSRPLLNNSIDMNDPDIEWSMTLAGSQRCAQTASSVLWCILQASILFHILPSQVIQLILIPFLLPPSMLLTDCGWVPSDDPLSSIWYY